MGAEFLTRVFPGTMTEKQLQTKFRELSDQWEIEQGTSYSGGWNMCTGLKVHMDPPLIGKKAAEDFLDGVCEKWEEAHAVRFIRKVLPATPSPERAQGGCYVNGGASGRFYAVIRGPVDVPYAQQKTSVRCADGLSDADKKELTAAVEEVMRVASKEAVEDEFFYLTHDIQNLDKDVTLEDLQKLLLLRAEIRALRKQRAAAGKVLKDLEDRLESSVTSTVTEWMMAGVCAS